MSAGWAEREREARRSERLGVGERKAPTAQILLAALLYSTITQKPLDHIWDVLVRAQEDTVMFNAFLF